jgi:hypothetical protein
VARLGHALIDLYVTVAKDRRSLELGRAQEEDGAAPPVERYLELLERQQIAGPGFGAYEELRLVGQSFKAIFDANLTQVQNGRLADVRRTIAETLGAQQPVGGMHGQANKSLIAQFRMPGYPLILATTDVLQEGEDLHTFCSEVFHYGISWTPSAMEQRVGRIDRVRSQTDRRLSGLGRVPLGEELLQVYVPTLRDSVEVLQVNRVLRRMDRFVELMHEGVGRVPDDDPRIDVGREAQESIEPPPPLPDMELKSSFTVDPRLCEGKRTALVVTSNKATELVNRLRAFTAVTRLGSRPIEWEPAPTDRNDRLFGTVILDKRQQPFGLYLRVFHGMPVLRCVSPVGRVDAIEKAMAPAQVLKGPGPRLGAIRDAAGSYDLTVEDEVLLLSDESSDARRLEVLLLRVAQRADVAEQALLELDQQMHVFKPDLVKELVHED